jgi:hypothetical protein
VRGKNSETGEEYSSSIETLLAATNVEELDE